jgi:hypothetical protein
VFVQKALPSLGRAIGRPGSLFIFLAEAGKVPLKDSMDAIEVKGILEYFVKQISIRPARAESATRGTSISRIIRI